MSIATKAVPTVLAASLVAGSATALAMHRSTSEENPTLPEPSLSLAGAAMHRDGEATVEAVRPGSVLAIGDNVMLGASRCLSDQGIDVSATKARRGADVSTILSTIGSRYQAVFIHVGNNGGVVDGDVQRAIEAVSPKTRVVWTTIQIPDPATGYTFEDRTNVSITNVVANYPNARIFDWNEATVRHPDWLSDGENISSTGCQEYARKVAETTGVAERNSGSD